MAHEHAVDVTEFRNEHLSLDRIAGPYTEPPHPGFKCSPLGAFRRKRAGKIRVIHDLSWPPGRSVNDYISSKDFTLSYVTVDQAANLTTLYPDPWLVKIDLKSAFLSCHVLPQNAHLLGFQWKDDMGVSKYYHFKVLCFGLKSSPRQFDFLASALQYIMIYRRPWMSMNNSVHYSVHL